MVHKHLVSPWDPKSQERYCPTNSTRPMTTIHFGVLLADPRGVHTHGLSIQLMDIGVVDVLANLSKEYIANIPGPDGDAIRGLAIDLKVHYIADSLEPVRATAGIMIVPTDTYESCPRLDYLWIAGATPAHRATAAEIRFVRERYSEVRTLFSVCTGAIILGATGIADGRNATGNLEFMELLKREFPNVQWSTEDRWVVDEEARLWTSGGPQTGIDMIATYMKQHFQRNLVRFAMGVGDFEIREQKYPTTC
jgi:putative intracellular protease/amidase